MELTTLAEKNKEKELNKNNNNNESKECWIKSRNMHKDV